MSRIGYAPIPVPSGVKINITNEVVEVEGPKGKLSERMIADLEVTHEDGEIKVARSSDAGPVRAKHGLLRSLIANAVTGVHEGFKKELEIVGVGYRGEVQGRNVNLSLGYSHPVVFAIPEGIEVEIDKANKITVSGASKQAVGQVAAKLRELRKPDPYKGKGIRYFGEHIRMKEGKAASGGTA